MTRWWWVRHAPTRAAGAVGWTDAPADLSDGPRLARLAAALPFAPVVSSDLARARATADRLAGARPQLPDARALRELDFGAWEGLAFDAAQARDPAAYAAFWADPGPARAPGGEGFDDLRARVAAFLTGVNAAPPGPDVIAVAHAGTIRAALALALGLSARQALGFAIDPLSTTRLTWLPEADAWSADWINRAP